MGSVSFTTHLITVNTRVRFEVPRQGLGLVIYSDFLATTHGTSTRRDECTANEGSERLAVLFKRLVLRIRTAAPRLDRSLDDAETETLS